MLSGSELSLDRATIERSMNRESAIMAKASLQGFKFIRLRLKNIKRRKISGIDAIVATDFTNDEMGGITDYYLEVKGGEIDFKYRPEFGMYLFDMLDTERNREFLASHLGGEYWEIQDKKIEADVTARAEIMAARMREKPSTHDAQKEFWEETHASEDQMIRAARGEVDIPTPKKIAPVQPWKGKVWDKRLPDFDVASVPHETPKAGVGVVSP